MKRLIVALFAIAGQTVCAQPPQWACSDDVRFLIGNWTGRETGVAGTGHGTREYQYILDGKYIYATNTSRFEAQERNPSGEVHRDWQFLSCDATRSKTVLRQFNSEGYVNQYVLERPTENVLRFESEALENSPEGTRARLTISLISENEFEEVFELAFAGKDYGEILRNHWIRDKQLDFTFELQR